MAYVIWVLASASVIPIDLYEEIKNEIALAELEDIDVTIKLPNRDTISPIAIVRDVEVLCGKTKYLLIFLFLDPHKIAYVPLYLVDPS